eukprot:1188625-Prorocentrum_minimum.AAC.1
MDMFDRLLILSDYCGDTLFVNNISSYDHSMVPRPVPRVVPRSRLRGEDVKGSSSNTNEATTTPAYYILTGAESPACLCGASPPGPPPPPQPAAAATHPLIKIPPKIQIPSSNNSPPVPITARVHSTPQIPSSKIPNSRFRPDPEIQSRSRRESRDPRPRSAPPLLRPASIRPSVVD